MTENLGDRIRARRDARRERDMADLRRDAQRDSDILDLKAHIDEHFDKLHARLDKLEPPEGKK